MENLLLLATDITGLPVVTAQTGEAIAEIRDIVYAPDQGRVLGFTLNKRGFLAGRMRAPLPFESTSAIGRDAVMVPGADVLLSEIAIGGDTESTGPRNVIGNDVLTEGGERLGSVTDLVVASGSGEVIGYKLRRDSALQGRSSDSDSVLIPLPYTLAVSGENLVVPSTVMAFVRDDLAGFGAAVDAFRAQLETP
jgi:uncharacterized protein YrrD